MFVNNTRRQKRHTKRAAERLLPRLGIPCLGAQQQRRLLLVGQHGNITLCKAKNITHKKAEKRELYGISLPHYSLFLLLFPVSHLYYKCIGLCPYPYLKFFDKNNTPFRHGELCPFGQAVCKFPQGDFSYVIPLVPSPCASPQSCRADPPKSQCPG